MINSGIYQIRNIINDKRYIGSTINIKKRFTTHVNKLNHNKHHSIYLQNAWNLYGEENFIFEVLENQIIKEDLLIWEQAFLDEAFDNDEQYNMLRFAGNTLGFKYSEETKLKISKANKGRVFSEERNNKISKANKGENNSRYGKHHSSESKELMSKAAQGKYVGELNPMYGKTHTDDAVKKIVEANLGRKFSVETCKRMGESRKGLKRSEATRMRMSESAKNRWKFFRENI